MRLALVCALPEAGTGLGAFVRRLVPELSRRVELSLWSCGPARSFEGLAVRPAQELPSREVDQILFHVGDEEAPGFCYPLLRRHGGTVLLHDWDLSNLARAAYPELARPGGRGFLRALREGGWAGAGAWRGGRELAGLNRTPVRLADSFLVFERELARAVVEERRAATPVGCLLDGALAARRTGGESAARLHARAAEGREEELVDDLLLRLATFPTHQSARKSVLRAAIEDADRRRAEKEAAGKD